MSSTTLARRPSATELAAATPDTRNRYVDFLRAFSIAVVVLGHWLLAVITYAGPDRSGVTGHNLLAVVPATQWLTLVLQVMPLFFLVGGYAHGASLDSAARIGVGYGPWVRARAVRLLRPVAVLLAVWVPLVLVLHVAGLDPELMRTGTFQIVVPLWFLAVYLGVVAAAPVMYAAHRRFGLAVPAALVAGAALVDVAHHGLGVPVIGWANFAFVWLALHQFGFVWRDGTLTRRPVTRWLLAAGGAACLLGLVFLADYPLSMVGADDGGRTNNLPPSLALVALGVWQTGLALIAEPVMQRWLRRPRVWAGVITTNVMAMTLYLWHLSAMVVVVIAVYLTGIWPDVEVGGPAWWLLRPVWVALLVAAVTPLVWIFSKVERHAAASSRRHAAGDGQGQAALAVVGALVSAGAIAKLVLGGLYSVDAPMLVPVSALAGLTLGMLLLGVLPVGTRH